MSDSKLDDWDIGAIKYHLKMYPNAKIINRGADNKLPEFCFHGNSVAFKASITCREDVFKQVKDIANKMGAGT